MLSCARGSALTESIMSHKKSDFNALWPSKRLEELTDIVSLLLSDDRQVPHALM